MAATDTEVSAVGTSSSCEAWLIEVVCRTSLHQTQEGHSTVACNQETKGDECAGPLPKQVTQ